MTYNIHPIFVHFPVALLFLYSVIKILPLRKFFPKVFWKHIERVLLVAGLLGACAAIYTGTIAKTLVQPDRELVRAHITFALSSTAVYSLLLFFEIIAVLRPKYLDLTNGKISKLLALAGIICISVTGMLGGVMVYGLSADPLAGPLLKLLGIHL